MADTGRTEAQESARLEAALDRIARAGSRAAPETERTETSRALLARRLDALIMELRQVLGRDSAD